MGKEPKRKLKSLVALCVATALISTSIPVSATELQSTKIEEEASTQGIAITT